MAFSSLDLNDLLFRVIAFLVAITVHEFAHAIVAYRFGDPTPKVQGRLTLNPIAHLDILGTLLILFGPFGWAKPVQFNPYNFKGNQRAGKILTTLAGPVSNLLVSIVFAYLFVFFLHAGVDSDAWNSFAVRLVNEVVTLNVIFFLFNLMPIAPLDGYWILADLLPRSISAKLATYEKYGPFLLLLIVFFGWTSYIITPLYTATLGFIRMITGI